MNLLNLLRNILNLQKKIDIKTLPSQGLFYKDDFEITIKKADLEDIIEYELNFVKDDLGLVISKLKKIVEKNSFFSKGYGFNDIKSIDIVFIFLEIVRFTKGKAISFKYFNDELGKEETIEFTSNFFNYYQIDESLMNNYSEETKEFIIDDYRFSLPSIGLENCLTNYLIKKSNEPDAIKFNNYNYDFTFFLSDKRVITFSEIDNLIQIFNFDMDESEQKKVSKIVKLFLPIQRYSLKRGDRVIEITSKINLEQIWK